MSKVMTLLKQYWPVVLLLVGVLVIILAWFFVIRKPEDKVGLNGDEKIPELPLEQRPFTTLTPTEDGHWLNLKITELGRVEAASMDYELLYQLPDGRTQGVPGSVTLDGKNEVERELLLGSESSGNFYYDEGVETGTLTLRFRSDKGKLIGKLATEFHLQSGTDELISSDGEFEYSADSSASSGQAQFYIVMNTFGLPNGDNANIAKGPYGVFGSDEFSGEVAQGWEKVSEEFEVFVVRQVAETSE